MKPMLIGSRAMDFWNLAYDPKSIFKRSSDWDIIADDKQIEELKAVLPQRVEHHKKDHLNNGGLYNFYNQSGYSVFIEGFGYIQIAPPQALYVLKRSHAWRRANFGKTITHIWKEGLHESKPPQGSYADQLLQERIKLTKKAYPQGNPKLNQTVDDFFDDVVVKKFNHDWIHSLYAYEEKPMFTRLQPDPEMAWCAKDLWEKLTVEQRNQCVAEESYVISTERFLVPKDYNFPPKLAFQMALDKVCTTLCSGWFRDWAIDHYAEIHDLFEPKRVEAVVEILKEEAIKMETAQ